MKYWIKMLAGLGMGIIVGTYMGATSSFIEPLRVIGVLFFRTLGFLVFPLLFFSGVRSILFLREQKRLFLILSKSVGYYLLLTVIGATIGVGLGDLLSPGVGINIGEFESPKVVYYPPTVNYILQIVPRNIFDFFHSKEMVYPILFIAFLIAIGIRVSRSESDLFRDIVISIDDTLHHLTILVLEFLPIGIFTYVGYLMGSRGSQFILPYLKLVLVILLGAFIHIFIIQTILIYFTTRSNPFTFIHALLPTAILAGTSSNRYTAYPSLVENMEHNLGTDREVFTFLAGMGTALSMAGSAIAAGVTVLFIAQAYGLDLSIYLQIIIVLLITVSSLKLDGLRRESLVILSVVLSYIVKLPQEGYTLILSITPLIYQIETVVNVSTTATVSYIITHREGAVHEVSIKDFM